MDTAIAASKEKLEEAQREVQASRDRAAAATSNHESIKHSVEALKKISEALVIRNEVDRLEGEMGGVFMAIGLCQDVRASSILLQKAKIFRKAVLPSGLHYALLESPTQARVQAVLPSFAYFETELKRWDKEIKKARKLKAPRAPKKFTGTTSQWKKAWDTQRLSMVGVLESKRARFKDACVELHEGTVQWAAKSGLQPVKLSKEKYSAAWKNFYSRNKRIWPKELPGLEEGQ